MFLAKYLNVSKPCTVVFDDCRDRECCHVVEGEGILKPSRFINRTAFDLQTPAGISQVKSFLEVFAPYLIAEV